MNSASQAPIAPAPIASLRRDPGRQLPAGRKAQGRSAVSAIQRDRMVTAVLQAVEEVGYARMTVNEVIGRVGAESATHGAEDTQRPSALKRASHRGTRRSPKT